MKLINLVQYGNMIFVVDTLNRLNSLTIDHSGYTIMKIDDLTTVVLRSNRSYLN